METKLCPECEKPVQGRSDKKFCSDYCRNMFNYRHTKDDNKSVKSITHTLKQNRKVLMELSPKGKAKVHRDELLRHGFDFTYHTHTYTTKRGDVYHLVFDYGYLPLLEGKVLVVHWDDEAREKDGTG